MKRGLSPLIATVLLLGLTVVLAASVLRWGGEFVIETTEETSEGTEFASECSAYFDIRFLSSSCYCRENITLYIQNLGDLDIESLLFRVHGYEPYTQFEERGLDPFSADEFILYYYLDNVYDGMLVEVYPAVEFEGENVTCTPFDFNVNFDRVGYCEQLGCKEEAPHDGGGVTGP